MKRILPVSILVGLTLLAQGQTSTPTSVNAVGYIRLDVPGTNAVPLGQSKLTMIAVPYVPVGAGTNGGDFTLDKVIGNNLHANASVTNADLALLWNPAQTNYLTAFLNNSGANTNTLNKWCYQAGANLALCATNTAFDLYPGRGAWLRNRGASTSLLLLGEVPSAGTETNLIGAGLQMIAYPYPVATNVQALLSISNGAYANASPDAADQMIFWTGTNYLTVFLNDGSGPDPSLYWKWCYMQGQQRALATNVVNPGDGFWYRRRGTGPFKWIEAKPYNWP